VVEGHGAATEEDESEGKGRQREREFISAVAHEAVVEVHLDDGDGEIDAERKSGHACEQAEHHEQTAKKLSEGGEVGGPDRESETGDELSVVVKSAEDLEITVAKHDGAQGEAHDEESEGLQAIKIAQAVPPAGRKIDYSSRT